jgi:hypothetical protein
LARGSAPAHRHGIVLSTNVGPGQLLTMVDDCTRRVRAFVDEGEISRVCQQQPTRITVDAVLGVQMDGVVENISAAVAENPFASNTSRQFRQVMISISGDQKQTPIGLRVSLSVQLSPCVSGQSSTGK